MGIGGVGVSSLAQVLLARGESVSGCDLKDSETTRALARAGAKIQVGHDPSHLLGQALLVYSAAVRPGNVELEAARSSGVRALSRAEFLSELVASTRSIAVAGTHGKTTTTHMLGRVLIAAGFEPTVLVGDGENTRVGSSDWLVAEADESDGSLVLHHPLHAIVTNLELDHHDHYADLATVRAVFARFLGNLREGGIAVVCAEDPELMALETSGRRVTYGIETGDYRWNDLGLQVGVPGRHNALNACGVAALALELGVEHAVVSQALGKFAGAHRRLERLGTWRGAVLYDDYGHHPTEVAATLQAARELVVDGGRLVLVFQPHRYTRLKGLMAAFPASFSGADLVLITEVYPAGEANPEGLTARTLAELVTDSQFAPDSGAVRALLDERVRAGDLVLFMGAGDVGKVGRALAE